MHLSHLTVADFRSYRWADLELSAGSTVLLGANGVGKTNLVEAIGYLGSHQSHRVSQDAQLVRFGQDRARIAGRVHRGSRTVALELEILPGRSNRVAINRGAPVRAREGLGILRTVVFAPEDLGLVTGEPGGRRRFLDQLMVQLRPALGQAAADYERVLRQRNALLKSARRSHRWGAEEEATLEVWDQHLAAAGARLLHGRLHVLRLLAHPLQQDYAALTNGSKAAAYSYESTVPLARGTHAEVPAVADLAADMTAALRTQRDEERARALTLVGPHRDELALFLGPAPARGYASHGETWSLALALRLAAYDVLVADDPDPDARPVLILDDVFAELDAARRTRLAGLVGRAEQVVVTAAALADVPAELAGPRVLIRQDAEGSEAVPAAAPVEGDIRAPRVAPPADPDDGGAPAQEPAADPTPEQPDA
ncbi:DNA replication/repair protein RecF [Micrococcus sp.]|uniref:DNA replication/repair protein RecF n=1 Tax=Micrococcus sp. TaxID=1271 RepID=UPI0026DD11C5|nr:DNA replication/repair protein RecF [Micrococcus sp.]MDO4240177.1 DNA replication/repair protein RecF [Micrococcus sp.]